jgi:glycosyltransferase involved in cell wall biosynthesis
VIQGKTISLIIPCKNERRGLDNVFSTVPACVDEVIIVDYKSTDGTTEFAASKGARVFHEPHKGYGAAYKRGMREAKGDIIVTSDGDGTYPIAEIPAMVAYLMDNGFDFISGCRFPLKGQKSMHIRNFTGNIIITSIAVALFRYKVTDLLSGMWVFKRDVLKHLTLRSSGWDFSEEITLEAIHCPEVNFAEYHIDYYERVGVTKLQPYLAGIQNILYLFYMKLIYLFGG